MAKTSDNEYFKMRAEQHKYFNPLSREERGKLFTAIFEYCIFGEPKQQLSGPTLTAYRIITSQIDEDGGVYGKKEENSV